MIVLVEEGRDPAQEQPQRPAVAEIDRVTGRMRRDERAATAPARVADASRCARGSVASSSARHAAVLARIVAEIPHPDRDPDQAHQRQHDERAAPGHQRDQQAISGGVSALPIRANEWVMPWAKPQLRSRHPDRHRARRGRKGRAFADAEGKPRSEQAREPADRRPSPRSPRRRSGRRRRASGARRTCRRSSRRSAGTAHRDRRRPKRPGRAGYC